MILLDPRKGWGHAHPEPGNRNDMTAKHSIFPRIFLSGTALICALSAGAALSPRAHARPLATEMAHAALPGGNPVLTAAAENMGPGAQKFIDGMAQRALDFLANATLSQEQKSNEFRKLLQDSFDLETIGRFALGRYWQTATPEERKEYQKLFRNMIVEVYSARFKEYKGQHVETRSVRLDGDKDTLVTSFIVQEDGSEIQVDWRVRYKSGHYQIVDVIVEGVSMSVTQRSDFSSVIQRGGGSIQALLTHLRK